MKKIIASIILVLEILSIGISPISAIPTDGLASPWTREKAAHLAWSVLLYADQNTIDTLYAAGSATNAVNLLFPDPVWPDRSEYTSFIDTYTSSWFNWWDGNHAIRLYQIMYATDPYEAKRKLFSLFEDIFAVNIDSGRNIAYKDIYDEHTLIYDNMLGNYQNLIKKIVYNNGQSGDFALWAFLDLFNQENPKNPNENYARELLQLFLMGEYKPGESKENDDIRNYEESDVKSLARILTGLKSDSITHAITFDPSKHYSGTWLVFLSGSLWNRTFPYYDSNSGMVNPVEMRQSVNGNNWITDNTVEYIFAMRWHEIALFLADRLYRFYIDDHPERQQLDRIAWIIETNNFDMLASVKEILALDMMYSDISMNQIRYKNPLELGIWTIKLLRNNTHSNIILDQNLYDTSLLRRLGWTPYYPGSIFGRDGFDDSRKWTSTSNQNAWMSATNYFTYRTSGTGVINFRSQLWEFRKEVTTEIIPIFTSSKNTFTGSLNIIDGTFETSNWMDLTLQKIANLEATGVSSDSWVLIPIIESTSSWSVWDTTSSWALASTGDTSSWEIIPILWDEIGTQSGETNEIISPSLIAESITSGSWVLWTGAIESLSQSGTIIETQTGSEIFSGTILQNKEEPTIINESQTGSEVQESQNISNEELVLAAAPELSFSGTIIIQTGTVLLPSFQIGTAYGKINIYSGMYDGWTHTLNISSWSLSNSGILTPIYSGSILLDGTSKVTADIISSDRILDTYERAFLWDKKLANDTRLVLTDFLTKDSSGNLLPVTPSSDEYYNKIIRGLLSILLSQPEYVLLRGADIPTTIETGEDRLLDTITGNLFFIELYWGNDYLSSIIPKDEYNTYLDYRTNQSGSIAITWNWLVDIWNFYMNSALAYWSGWTPWFKSLYDQGYLKIFNRVWAYEHSQDHDAAAKQISSYSNTTSATDEWLFWHLVRKEFESSHTISLWAKIPNIYRWGRYMNLWWNVILNNPLNNSMNSHMTLLSQLVQQRQFPGNTRSLFQDAGRISDIAKLSLAQWGPSGANGDMNNIFKFSKVLLNNNIGRSFYMGGYGGYDTHWDQFNWLNKDLQFVSDSVTKFFNEVKDTEDVTIVIFSEFWRTNKVNGSLGTDHGDGWWMIVISSNANLRNMLQNGTYGNMSIKNAKSNSLGIGIDYRSVYGSIFQSLYNIDGKWYFNDATISLDDDISMDPNEVSLLSYSYQASWKNIIMNGEFRVTWRNYNTWKAWYTRLLSWTGANALKNTNLKEVRAWTGKYQYTFKLNSSNQPYFTIDSFSNQYAQTTLWGTLTGSSIPMILSNTTRTISQTGSSILPVFAGTSVPTILSGSWLILNNTLSWSTLSLSWSTLEIIFSSWITSVTELTSSGDGLVWNGWFILSEIINRDYFIPQEARIDSDGKKVERTRVAKLIKIWADKLGIGMKLNQNFMLRFLSVPTDDAYRIISSEDGIHWTDVESPGKEYIRDQNGTISVPVGHLTYFALLSNTITLPPPTCTISVSPSTLYNNQSTLLRWNIVDTNTWVLMPWNLILSGSGNISIIPPTNTTTTYTLNVTNTSGNASCNTAVTTSQEPWNPIIGGSSWPGGPSSPVRSVDICPDGDLSGSQYDGSCEPWIITQMWSWSYREWESVVPEKQEKKPIIRRQTTIKRVVNTENNIQIIEKLPKYLYVTAEHALTFRAKPFVSVSTVLGYLGRNAQVEVIEEGDEWMKVLIDWVEWFVKSSYLRRETSADRIRRWDIQAWIVPDWIVQVEHSWFIRKAPHLGARIIAVVHSNDTVMILDELPQWYEIRLWDGSLGYIGKSLIKTSMEMNTKKRVLK